MTGNATSAMQPALPRALSISMAVVGLFVACLTASILQGVNPWDESWFLQVLNRVSQGELLYKDVFFNVPPLSVDIGLILVRLLGAQLIVVKSLVAASYAAVIMISVKITRQLRISRPIAIAAMIGLGILYVPVLDSPYKPVAQVFFLASLGILLDWVSRIDASQLRPGSSRALLLCGLCAGLCFATYQLLGAYCLVALVMVVILVGGFHTGGRMAPIGGLVVMCGGFLVAAALFLVPVWLNRAVPEFLDYVFLRKLAYAQVAGESYFGQAALMAAFWTQPTLDSFRQTFYYSAYLLPPVVILLLALKLARTDLHVTTSAAVSLFVIAGFAAAFPRVDWLHFSYALPMLLIGLAHGLDGLGFISSRLVRRGVLVLTGIWLVVGAGAKIGSLVLDARRAQFEVSSFTHFRFMLFPERQIELVEAAAEGLSVAARDGPLFILSPDAGFYYLVSGVRNPTPFDYPLVTAFGANGETHTINLIQEGTISQVCMRSMVGTAVEGLRAARLEDFVSAEMNPGANLEACTLYRSP